MTKYYDDWRTKEYVCPACKWRGFGLSLKQGERTNYNFELDCPACKGRMDLIRFPTIDEIKENPDKATPALIRKIESVDERRKLFERAKLIAPEQLPDINLESFVLAWDFECDKDYSNWRTIIRLGDRIIFEEPAWYEGYERFGEVAKILRARYGRAIKDLVPTTKSLLQLLGDSWVADGSVLHDRRTIFEDESIEDMLGSDS